MSNFTYQGGVLHCEDVSLSNLATSVGTPFYCYSSSHIASQYNLFSSAFSDIDHLVCYSVKANSNQAILSTLSNLGSGMDIVSQGELHRSLSASVPASKILFSGVGKRSSEIDAALGSEILCFNVESKSELDLLSLRAQSMAKAANISLRINPDIDAGSHAKITTGTSADKFGIPLSDAVSLYNYASNLSGIVVRGIDVHIGSQITDLLPFKKTFECLVDLLGVLRSEGHDIAHIDLGGGLGVDYADGNSPIPLSDYANLVKKHMSNLNIKLLFEPGRYLVANSGILATQVLYLKESDKTFIVVDAAMNDLIRPTLYDAHHGILPLSESSTSGSSLTADIVGPVCESGDYLALSRSVPRPNEGDYLVFCGAGAYGSVQSSTYNSRLLVPEVLVRGSDYHVIRPRPSYEDLLGLDSLPSWLV